MALTYRHAAETDHIERVSAALNAIEEALRLSELAGIPAAQLKETRRMAVRELHYVEGGHVVCMCEECA